MQIREAVLIIGPNCFKAEALNALQTEGVSGNVSREGMVSKCSCLLSLWCCLVRLKSCYRNIYCLREFLDAPGPTGMSILDTYLVKYSTFLRHSHNNKAVVFKVRYGKCFVKLLNIECAYGWVCYTGGSNRELVTSSGI
jgi:hypothetical protein